VIILELWIASQNNDRLIKVNAIIIASFNDLVAIHGYIDNDTHVWLGNYKSKERAKEVLHEIKAYINEGYRDVYEMPEN
jgi:phage replication-related protein YjqB (UPF0714/DUF867 family)